MYGDARATGATCWSGGPTNGATYCAYAPRGIVGAVSTSGGGGGGGGLTCCGAIEGNAYSGAAYAGVAYAGVAYIAGGGGGTY